MIETLLLLILFVLVSLTIMVSILLVGILRAIENYHDWDFEERKADHDK